jgi:transposase
MGNPHVTKFANTVEKHIDPILAWYDHSIATGPLEGLNNKIKVLKRAAYGYRDTSFFALSLLFIHETAFNLSGA